MFITDYCLIFDESEVIKCNTLIRRAAKCPHNGSNELSLDLMCGGRSHIMNKHFGAFIMEVITLHIKALKMHILKSY